MGNVVSWELISATPVEGGVEVTALVEHCDGTTRLVTQTASLTTKVDGVTPESLEAWVKAWSAALRGKPITPS